MKHTIRSLTFFLTVTLLFLFISCDDFFEEDISDQSVQIVAPANGVEIATPKISLAWKALKGASAYHVVVVSPSFDNIQTFACDSILQDSLLTNYKVDLTLANGEYQWSVQAKNSGYESLPSYESFKIIVNTEGQDAQE